IQAKFVLVVEGVGGAHLQFPRVSLLAIGAEVHETQRLAVLRTFQHRPRALVESARAPMETVCAVIGGESASLPAEREGSPPDAAGVSPQEGSEVRRRVA